MLSTIALTVNTLGDDPSGPIAGQTTLRDAITQADAGTGNSYVIKFAVKGTIDFTSALLDLSNNITIKGPGASDLTVQRDPNAVPFSIFTVDSGVTVSLSGMTISGGNDFSGSGVDNSGTLTVRNSIFSNDSAFQNGGGEGGGIFNGIDSTATVVNCIFTGNSSADGGGFFNYGDAAITSSIFANNSSNSTYQGLGGGGIFNASHAALTIGNSVFTNNTAIAGGGDGGAIVSYGVLTVTGSFFANNSAAEGGGILNGSLDTTTINSSTFINNSAIGIDGGYMGIGGGILNEGTALIVTDSIFINNTASTAGGGLFTNGEGTATVNDSFFASNSALDSSFPKKLHYK
jgi:hypothetical protein